MTINQPTSGSAIQLLNDYHNEMDLFFQRIEFLRSVWADSDCETQDEAFYLLMDVAEKYRGIHDAVWVKYENVGEGDCSSK